MKKFLLLLIIPFLIFGQIVECDDDFAPLTLSWFGADSTTTFNIVGLSSGELYSQSIFNISGEITDCFPINLEDDCFTISISGPETLSWNLYTYFSNEPFISGTNEDFIFGPQCLNSGCTDITACNYDANAEIESGDCIYPALTFSNNDTIPDEPPVNFNYSAWDGCPFGGVDIWVSDPWIITDLNFNNQQFYNGEPSQIISMPPIDDDFSFNFNVTLSQINCNSFSIDLDNYLYILNYINDWWDFGIQPCNISTENGNNIIYWDASVLDEMIYQEEVNTEDLVSYNIYSSIVNTDNFNLVGSINAGNYTYSFNDVISEASNSAYKYKVTAVDSCGNESRLDNAYQISSCYLDVSSNSNLVQLSFNAFQGFNHNTYDIYRSNNNDEYELVGSIPWLGDSNLNWLDLNPPSNGCNNYFVQTTNLDCSFSEVSRSNIVSVCQENEEINCDTIYIDNFIIDTIYVDNFIIDTIYVDNFIIDTITEYVDVIITEFVDCDTGLPCDSEILEIINNSKKYGKIYNLLGQEILRREGIYIEGGEVKFRLK